MKDKKIKFNEKADKAHALGDALGYAGKCCTVIAIGLTLAGAGSIACEQYFRNKANKY